MVKFVDNTDFKLTKPITDDGVHLDSNSVDEFRVSSDEEGAGNQQIVPLFDANSTGTAHLVDRQTKIKQVQEYNQSKADETDYSSNSQRQSQWNNSNGGLSQNRVPGNGVSYSTFILNLVGFTSF